MTRLSDQTIATLELTLDWQCLEAAHRERFLARKVNPWRDIFPPGLQDALTGLEAGQSAKMDYAPGQAISDYDPSLVYHLPESAFSISSLNG
ncbi:MAG: hypothetical protein HY795_06365 [Desulfovibrio sp.]|nr:hypothetical protein [Desulfovibrio sp.]